MANYEYQPLSTPRSFRVIVLKPAVLESQPLEVELHEALLGEPHYEALSYTWGQRHGTIPIRCYTAANLKGRKSTKTTTILITPNCESALRHLRHRFKARQLWIDSICIDQSSMAEKNQQVPLMGEIYMSAARTVIWLGPGETGDESTLSRARTAGGLVYFRTMPGCSALGDKEKAWARKILSAREVERIGRICQNDWFQRIWTFQEYLLTDGGAVFMVGRAECPVSKLYTYFIIGEALHESDSRERRLFRMRSRIMEDLVEVRNHHDSDSDGDDNGGKKRRKKKGNVGVGLISSVTGYSNRPPGGGLYSMLSLTLQMAAMSDATDPRDKVYGMLAYIEMLCVEMHVPTVDYAKSLQDLFEEFAVCMIRSGQTLWPLEHIAGHLESRDDGVDRPWPSWVPDLRQSRLIASPEYWCTGLKRVLTLNEGGVADERSADTPQGHLKLKGRRMTKISEVYNRMPEIPIDTLGDERQIYEDLRVECLSQWSAHAIQLDESTRPDHAPGVERETYLRVFGKLTPYLDYLRQRHEPSTEIPRKLPRHMRRRFDDLYDGSTLFLTRCGLLGLCRGDVQTGDHIYQLAGGKHPFVLRKVRGIRPLKYQLVGVASIDSGERAQREGFWLTDIAEVELDDIVLV